MSQQNRFRADLRELRFVLFEQLKLQDILGQAPYQDWGKDEADMAIQGCYTYAMDVLGPLNAASDRVGCQLKDGKVIVPEGFKAAWDQLYAAGWKSLAVDTEYGGQGAPYTLHAISEELTCGANAAFTMYPGLTYGVADLVHTFGTPSQKERYLHKLFNGGYSGTMCLTEPQAGSDVGMARTKAVKRPDGLYNITGTKMFISCGDHDLAENIVHMVLARVEGAAAGTKGLSLFIIPKYRVNADGSRGAFNDVNVMALEHKLGLNASATCLLSFGENGDCVGELVGTQENVGMRQMFQLMNFARIAVGIQSVGVATSAYLNALEYARNRKQGASITQWKDASAPRVSILEHADIRRSLLDMKARLEGIRALLYKLTMHFDTQRVIAHKDEERAAYHRGQVDLLVPLVKAYGSDQAFRICENALQVLGGVGYTKDFPIEQYLRDAKIFSIYEGTNHIQAMDLVARKLGQDGGAHFRGFLDDIGQFVSKNAQHPELGAAVAQLSNATEAFSSTAMRLLGWSGEGRISMIPLASNRVLEMMSEVAVGWMLLEAGAIACEKLKSVPAAHPDHAFYQGKKAAAIYFAKNVLPEVEAKARILALEDESALDIPDAGFATV